MQSLARSRRFWGLVVCLLMFALVALELSWPQPPTPSAPPAAVSVQLPPLDPAPAAPARGVKVGLLLLVAGSAVAVMQIANAATQFGTADGEWETAGNWTNGVPTSILSAIISSTGGVPVLPERTSAITKNLTGGGSIGICGGGVNYLKVVTPSANTVLRFTSVEHMERKTSSVSTPRGHG